MDPRLEVGPQNRRANLSPLMQAKLRASLGEKVNFCPFGCGTHDLDEQGYCRHLVGFTTDGKSMEPLAEVDRFGNPVATPGAGTRKVLGTRTTPVPQGAKLERITVSYRVYVEEPELERATRPELV